MSIVDVMKNEIFGETMAEQISNIQLANYLAVGEYEQQHYQASELEIYSLQKRILHVLYQAEKLTQIKQERI